MADAAAAVRAAEEGGAVQEVELADASAAQVRKARREKEKEEKRRRRRAQKKEKRGADDGTADPSSSALEVRLVEVNPSGESQEHLLLKKKTGPPKAPFDISDFQKQDLDQANLRKEVKDFYKNQNEEIAGFQEIEMRTTLDFQTDQVGVQQHRERIVMAVSLTSNVLLIASLGAAAALSGSLSILASVMESGLELFSSVLLALTVRAKRRVNPYMYPEGRERLEPVGVLAFSSIMGTAALLLVIESIKHLVANPMEPPDIGWTSLGVLIGTISLKSVLYIFCRLYGPKTLTVKTLALDHFQDAVLNSVALLTSYLGALYWPPLDSVGAIIIALWVMYNWGNSCLEQVRYLTGKTATPDFLKKLTWICVNHDPEMIALETVRAFHFGTRYLVEVDIVLPGEMTVMKAHDIGETLQNKIEALEEVERAFVHIDFNAEHDAKAEHKQWGS